MKRGKRTRLENLAIRNEIKLAYKTVGKRTKNRNNSIIHARPSEISIEITAHAEENKRL
jgi:hypothetical protein